MSEPQISVEAEGLEVRSDGETEAHAARGRARAETEAHGTLRLDFPPDLGETRLEVTYRPATEPGGPPEVELHRIYSTSDARLKRDIRAV